MWLGGIRSWFDGDVKCDETEKKILVIQRLDDIYALNNVGQTRWCMEFLWNVYLFYIIIEMKHPGERNTETYHNNITCRYTGRNFSMLIGIDRVIYKNISKKKKIEIVITLFVLYYTIENIILTRENNVNLWFSNIVIL